MFDAAAASAVPLPLRFSGSSGVDGAAAMLPLVGRPPAAAAPEVVVAVVDSGVPLPPPPPPLPPIGVVRLRMSVTFGDVRCAAVVVVAVAAVSGVPIPIGLADGGRSGGAAVPLV